MCPIFFYHKHITQKIIKVLLEKLHEYYQITCQSKMYICRAFEEQGTEILYSALTGSSLRFLRAEKL